MSEASVSTTSSRIKQFGLYRTIDARTEEFLRLSRKRQLRQGCACAAVSTAITVTIVVSVILIYEYGIISELSSKSTLRPNWLGLMNTSESMPFEAKFNKASINLESSIHLLPLVLKALKKNRYYDNIMADDSSPSPLYEKKETDDLLTKNIFSDTRNWMRIPSRIYAIEYKTSPIVYYKNPTRNTDYFTKIRRIRDYQRIMNYVDKMISEKITGSTMPMLKSSYAFDKNLHISSTTPMPSMTYKTKNNLQTNPKELINSKKPKCSCPKKMHALLNKVITILQKLLPNTTQDLVKMPKPCDHNHKHITNNVTVRSLTTAINLKTAAPIKLQNVGNLNAFSESQNTFEGTLPTVTKTKLKQAASLLKSLPPKVDYTLQTIIKLIRPKIFKENPVIDDLHLHNSKTIKQTEESTEDYYFSPEDKSQPLTILNQTSSNALPKSVMANMTNIIVDQDPLRTNDLDTTSYAISTLPTFNEETDNYYSVGNTTPNIINTFNALDVHSLELVKNKLIPNKMELNTKGESLRNKDPSKILHKGRIFKNSSLIKSLLRKMGQLIKSESMNPEAYTEEPIDNVTHQEVAISILNKKTDYMHSVDSIPPYSQTISYFTSTPLYTTRKSILDKNESDLTFKLEDITLEDEEEKMSYEEALNSSSLKKLEKIINTLNKTEKEPHKTINETPLYQWESIYIEENNSTEETTKHNIPKSRSSYLEIQRNDWKHDEQQDYDNNVVLLIYEYMITVETSLVQNKRFNSNHTQDLPIADRLDRSHFGFDQDYYEKMPLLVNGLQEVNYVDPSVDIAIASLKTNKRSKTIYIRPTTATNIHKFIKRTSPRPFVFEHKSPYPKPFSKLNGNPKNWVERYRNAERLKNLHEVVKYLEKTLHAKFGDMYLPNKAQMAFSGALMPPMNEDVHSQNGETPQSSRKVEIRSNHQSDRLYTYRPDNPGDVNMLADGFRFSPTIFSTINRKKTKYTLPKHRPFPDVSKTCFDNKCDKKNDINIEKTINLPSSVLIKSSTVTKNNKPNSVNLLLNLLPSQTTNSDKNDNELEKNYITTSKPLFHYKRKITYPVRRTFSRSDRPKFVGGKRENDYEILKKKYESLPKVNFKVNFNVYSTSKRDQSNIPKVTEKKNIDFVSTSTASTSTKPYEEVKYSTDYPLPNFSSVEDYHVGSSGVIPIVLRPTVSYPIVTPIVPMTSTTTTTETVFTNPPEIFKFSPEDAKIPDQYRNIEKSNRYELEGVRNKSIYGKFSKSDKQEVIRKKLLIKLKNIAETTTTTEVSSDYNISNVETTTNFEIGIATGTYVPQINGHYRNMRHKTLTRILQESSERYRKKRLENLLTTPKSTYVPTMYPPHKTSRK